MVGKGRLSLRRSSSLLSLNFGLNSFTFSNKVSVKKREAFLALSLGDAPFGSKPLRCSASLCETKLQPISCAYFSMRACTLLCSVGLDIGISDLSQKDTLKTSFIPKISFICFVSNPFLLHILNNGKSSVRTNALFSFAAKIIEASVNPNLTNS